MPAAHQLQFDLYFRNSETNVRQEAPPLGPPPNNSWLLPRQLEDEQKRQTSPPPACPAEADISECFVVHRNQLAARVLRSVSEGISAK